MLGDEPLGPQEGAAAYHCTIVTHQLLKKEALIQYIKIYSDTLIRHEEVREL
jgi:hypothetical protein